ncbi:cytochrome c biogenesis protein DipZ [Candidatus Saccharibacteria bacterium]|nr:cytochrome c biogenesis protein DipZ [Candidatus Saccharibacteria bacterium]
MFLLFGAFFAGIITVLAPCVLPLLPVIIGGSVSGNIADKRRPYIIAASLAVSLILFTVLLKATTLLISVPPQVITYISGGIIVGLGIVFLFPKLYETVIIKLNIQAKSQQLLGKGSGKGAVIGAIITGAALGPVFSSCSPVYAYILATVLPVNFGVAMVYMVAYVLGLSLMLLLIGFLGQKLVRRLKFASNPRGWFTRIVAILFIVVGLLVITGYDKKLQTYVSEHTPFNFDKLSAQLIPNKNKLDSANGVLNVKSTPAPEFTGLSGWINSQPLKLSDLKGKVVLVDFWTYSCINCIRTQPHLKSLYSTYKDSGFVIVGVHAPEFAFEKDPKNVAEAAKKAGLNYPIALDNDFATWNAFNNQYWPSSYLIDKEGNIRRIHEGEGEYKETEQAVRQLLAENGGSVPAPSNMMNESDSVPISSNETPETYLGKSRASNYEGSPALTVGTNSYTLATTISRVNNWTLGGSWKVTSDGITAEKDSVIKIRFAAKELYFVTGNDIKARIELLLNGKPISGTGHAGDDVKDSSINVSQAQLYRAVKFKDFQKDMTLELKVPAGVQLNTFTFGS